MITPLGEDISLVVRGQLSFSNLIKKYVQGRGGHPKASDGVQIPNQLSSKLSIDEYHWKLNDIYENSGNVLKLKTNFLSKIAISATLSWNTKGEGPFLVQLSKTPHFPGFMQGSTLAKYFRLSHLSLGTTYWRVSLDGDNWSEAKKIEVNAQFNRNLYPSFAEDKATPVLLELNREGEEISFSPSMKMSIQNVIGWVVQENHLQPDGQSYNTQLHWSGGEQPKLRISRSGIYIYRFRAVAQNQELSEWSKDLRVQVVLPPALVQPLPTLTKSKHIKKPTAAAIRAPENPPVEKFVEKPSPVVAEQPVVRQPASAEAVTSIPMPPPLVMTPRNEKYNSTQISAEGILWSLFSTDQYYNGRSAPLGLGAGLHGYYWQDHHGVEGAFESAAVALNSSAEEARSMRKFEGRYHFRFYTPSLWSASREYQLSLFGGYESYYNSGAGFISKYGLLKVGTAIQFPWRSQWMGGGEFAYGSGSGVSKKEMAGNVYMFLNKQWSLGLGYRVYFLELTSASLAPGGELPYREAFGEGYTIVNYHF